MEKTFEFGDYKVTTYCEDDLLFNWKLSHNGTDSEDWLTFFTAISQPNDTKRDWLLDRIADLETSRENMNCRFARNEGYHQKVLERLEKLETWQADNENRMRPTIEVSGGVDGKLTNVSITGDATIEPYPGFGKAWSHLETNQPKPEFTEDDIVPGLKVMHPFFKENGLLAQTGEFSFAICLEKVETRRHLTATFAPKGITQYLNTNGFKKGWSE